MTHFSESWLREYVQVSLSTLSGCNPTLGPTQPSSCLPPCKEHNKYQKALEEYHWKMLCWQTWMWGWVLSAVTLWLFPGFMQLYCSLKSKRVVALKDLAHLEGMLRMQRIIKQVSGTVWTVLSKIYSKSGMMKNTYSIYSKYFGTSSNYLHFYCFYLYVLVLKHSRWSNSACRTSINIWRAKAWGFAI